MVLSLPSRELEGRLSGRCWPFASVGPLPCMLAGTAAWFAVLLRQLSDCGSQSSEQSFLWSSEMKQADGKPELHSNRPSFSVSAFATPGVRCFLCLGTLSVHVVLLANGLIHGILDLSEKQRAEFSLRQ